MKLDTQTIRDTSEGIIQKVDVSITPPNSASFAINLLFDDTIGRAVVRPGTVKLGDTVVSGKSCLGLYLFKLTNGTKVLLSSFNKSDDTVSEVRSFDGSAWGSADTTYTASTKARFLTFANTVALMTGGAVKTSADGSTWVTTGGNLDAANFPQAKYGITFKSRVLVAGVSATPDRLLFSSIINGGTVSWTSGNGYVDVDPEDGGGTITGLSKVPGYALIFKERSMKRWDGQSTYPEDLISIGAPSQEAIVRGRQSVFFFNSKGIFETTGGFPRKISRRVQKIIEAISSTYYTSVSGWSDGDRVFFSIGDITFEGQSFSNVVLMYTIDSQNWSAFSFPNELKYWGLYIDSNNAEYTVAGDDAGNVWKVLSGVGDNGADIPWLLQYQTQDFGSWGRMKEFSRIVTFTQDIRNGRLSCRTDETKDYKTIGQGVYIKDSVTEIKAGIKGRTFDFRLQGESRTGQIIGIEIPEIEVSENYVE